MARGTRFPALTAVVLLAASAAQAQTHEWFLLLVGQTGPISAHSGTILAGLTDQTKVLSYGQNFFLPLDPSTGLPGPMEFRPLRLAKGVDGSSPRIAQALANSEVITACVLTLYDRSSPGVPVPLYEIVLGTPQIVAVSGGGESNSTMGVSGTETVSILFQSLTLTDAASGQTSTIP